MLPLKHAIASIHPIEIIVLIIGVFTEQFKLVLNKRNKKFPFQQF